MNSSDYPSDFKTLRTLKEIIKKLRSSTGCQWNRAQTSKSLKKYLIEEAVEAAEALDEDDPLHFQEELGDVLHQVALQSELASEKGHFELEDVIEMLNRKLVERNPHVFKHSQNLTFEQVEDQWKKIKTTYNQKKRFRDVGQGKLPLARAICLKDEAAKTGFDWPNIQFIYDNIRDEAREVEEAVQIGDRDHIEEEVGDLLMSVASLARALKVDPNIALMKSNQKFALRFEQVLEQLKDRAPVQSIEEWIELWKNAKERVSSIHSSPR